MGTLRQGKPRKTARAVVTYKSKVSKTASHIYVWSTYSRIDMATGDTASEPDTKGGATRPAETNREVVLTVVKR